MPRPRTVLASLAARLPLLTLAVSLLFASASLSANAAAQPASPGPPLAPAARLQLALDDAQPAFLACGTRSRVDLAALRLAALTVDVATRRPTVTVQPVPAGPRGRALVRCLEQAARRAVRRIASSACVPSSACALTVRPFTALTPTGRPPADLQAGCTSNADCALVCPALPDCCGGQCGCNNAILRIHAAVAQAGCTRNQMGCPPVGCALEEYNAACRDGRCVAVPGGPGGF